MSEIKKLKMNYIFIDFENVQPSNLDKLVNTPFKVLIFVGANQTKVSMELAISMQKLGDNAQYIKINGNGKNALDFHITFYLGQLYEKEPEGYFHIISKDTGFDVLINHLKNKNTSINRYSVIEEIPFFRSHLSMSDKIDLIKKFLLSRGDGKPKKIIALNNTISSLFHRTLELNEIELIMNAMIKDNLLSFDDNTIRYNF